MSSKDRNKAYFNFHNISLHIGFSGIRACDHQHIRSNCNMLVALSLVWCRAYKSQCPPRTRQMAALIPCKPGAVGDQYATTGKRLQKDCII